MTRMESLPPVGWARLATKEDLVALEERIDAKFTVFDAKFTAVDAKFTAVDAKVTVFDAKVTAVDAKFTAVDAKVNKSIAQQTDVILVGLAAMIAPIYLALFTGAAG